jgi:UDP-glucose 4-epimerase
MTTLVTGGAGFVGSHLVDHLLADGRRVRVLDNLSSGKLANLAQAQASGRLETMVGSVLDRPALARAMKGVDTVYHLAIECVRRSLGKPIENHDVNATGTLYALEAARAEGVKRFVYCSSSEVYGNAADGPLDELATVCAPVTVYGAAKYAGELYALAYWRTYRLPAVIVRPFNAYGPREHDRGELAEVLPRFVIRVLNGLPPIIFGDGAQGRDFTYVTETARGLAAAEKLEIGLTVNLGHGRLVTIAELAEAVLRACGRPDLDVEFAAPRPGDVHRLIADTRRAKAWLGFEPQIPLEEGIARYLDWFRATYPDPRRLLESRVTNWEMPRT